MRFGVWERKRPAAVRIFGIRFISQRKLLQLKSVAPCRFCNMSPSLILPYFFKTYCTFAINQSLLPAVYS